MLDLVIRSVLLCLIFATLMYINDHDLRRTKWADFSCWFYVLLFFILGTTLAIKLSTMI